MEPEHAKGGDAEIPPHRHIHHNCGCEREGKERRLNWTKSVTEIEQVCMRICKGGESKLEEESRWWRRAGRRRQ